jgi:chorismate-pyruvate lyase
VSTDAGFDPLSDLFLAQFDRPAELGSVNLRTLSPFQRALLVIDGTVTKFIEAYTMEPLEVIRLAQVNRELKSEHRWLELPEGSVVAVRHVMIRGEYSHNFYVYAVSSIVLDRLPEEIRGRVETEVEEGLGRILNANKQESRRDVLWYGRERVTELPEEVRRVSDGEFVSRTYRIIVREKPIMMINEKFPSVIEHLPSHH